jgi:ParB family chromosome partitioning protein
VVSAQGLRALAVDPSGQYVAAAGDDGIVHVLMPDTPGPLRDMPGHDGPVNALCFTPRDGRLVSGGEDGTLRIWYLVGAIESEVRTTDGQAAPVLALVFPPTPGEQADGSAPIDRIFAASADGKLRAYRLDERRKPRTLDCGSKALHALCFLPPAPSAAAASLGAVAAGGDGRTVYRYTLDAAGSPGDKATAYDHGFDALAATFGSARPAREAAYLTLAGLADSEALELLLRQLSSEKEPELRALIARELGQHGRKPARAALRQALDDGHALVRAAALAALRAIEGAQALGPLRAALGSRYPDVRIAALAALGELGESSPLVPGLITAALTDSDAGVRLGAMEATTARYPKDSPEPLRLCFERGPADLRSEALVRAAFAGLLTTPELSRLLSRALDDEDGEVRRLAFALQVLLRQRLAALLSDRDEDFSRTVQEIARRRVLRLRALKPSAAQATGPSEQELAAARADLIAVLARREGALTAAEPGAIKARLAQPERGASGGELREDDLQPLLTAMACRTPATALRGARGLALLGDTRALGALLQLSRESAPELRREAAAALKALHDPRARRRLVWMLDDADAGVRAAALDAYAELCGRADTVDELAIAEAALRSSYEDIRVRGLQRLIQLGQPGIGPRSPQVEALLSNALEDEAPKVRAEALRTLWSWHEPDPAAVLDRALAARFPDLRLRAVEELLRLGEAGWAQGRLRQAIADRDADVAQAAYDAVVKLRGKEDAEAHLLATASIHRKVREAGARGAAHVSSRIALGAPGEPLRAALLKLLGDEDSGVRLAALEALDRLLPKDSGPLVTGLGSGYLDLRVRAAELLAERRDERLIDPMRALLADPELVRRYPAAEVARLRLHAAMAIANLGAPATVKYQATELVKDSSPEIREQAARGLATAARPGDEGYLLDLLGHPDIWVRSWAADGLARLGDSRALPVLTGTLRHEHLPIRFSAIISFVALGPEGYGGVLQGLEDPNREVQELVFAIILSRDLQAFRRGQPPDLLVSALSSQRAEVRFAAARALELRVEPEAFLGHVIEALMPPRPDKAQDMKDWPSEEARGHILLGLVDALGSDRPDLRYAAATMLRLRRKPLEYFREAQRLSRPRAADAQVVPDTAPRLVEADAPLPKRGLLRRLFHGDEPLPEARRPATAATAPSAHSPVPNPVSAEEAAHLRRLAFGAYVGLLRQVSTSTDEERVRRDAVDRIVELGQDEGIGRGAALPPVVRALDDPQYLVRKAAFAGLKRLFPAGSDEPLRLALRGAAADVARAALDEFAARGASATGPIAAALSSQLAEVRRYAFELLERLSEKGSLEPLLLALQSEYADLRIGVIERLATQSDSRVTAALQRAMESDHADLRLRAAELLVERRDDRAADVLGAFLRAEDSGVVARARAALVRLRSERAVRALAARLERDEDASGAQLGARVQAALSLGQTGHAEAIEPLASCLEDEAAELRKAAFDAALDLLQRAAPKPRDKGPELPLPFGGPDGDRVFVRRDEALLLRFLRTAARAKDPAVRLRAAEVLGAVRAASGSPPGSEADELLGALLSDRAVEVRRAAVAGYSRRVIEHGADLEPLLGVLRTGVRELLLPAAEGAAARGQAAALRPLLLFSRAGEADERPRALLSLGTLGDVRALPELETVAAGGTEEVPLDPESGPAMKAAAIEALGRMAAQGKPSDPEARRRVIERVEEASEGAPESAVRQAAVRGLRPIGGERVRARLESILLDESAPGEVRAEAARQLGFMKDVAAEPALARALSDWDSDVHTEARRALDRLFPNERTRVEFLAVDSSQDEISEPAAAYLAVAGDPALLVPRLATLKDEELRARLRYGLLRRPELAVNELVALLGHDDPSAREAAAWLLGTRAGQGSAIPATAASALLVAERRTAERFVASAPDRRDAEERAWVRLLWAATNAAASGTPEVAARARELLAPSRSVVSVPGEVRQQAVRALLRHRRPSEAEDSGVLSAALADADPLVREAAAAALATITPERAFSLAVAVRPFDPVAFAPAAQRPKPDELRSPEGRRLGLPGVLAAHDSATLLLLLRDPDAAVRLDAVAGLGRTGGEQAITALRALAFDKKGADEALRKAAYRAYRRAKRRTEQQKKHEAQP